MFLVIALGYAIGSVNIRGFNLGIGARTNRLDLSVSIARGSASPIALFVAPGRRNANVS